MIQRTHLDMFDRTTGRAATSQTPDRDLIPAPEPCGASLDWEHARPCDRTSGHFGVHHARLFRGAWVEWEQAEQYEPASADLSADQTSGEGMGADERNRL